MTIQIETISIIDHDETKMTPTLTITTEGNEISIQDSGYGRTTFDVKYLDDLIRSLNIIKEEHN